MKEEKPNPKTIEQPFVENGYMERLLNLAKSDPQTFQTLSPATRLSVGYYAAAKRRHALLHSDSPERPA